MLDSGGMPVESSIDFLQRIETSLPLSLSATEVRVRVKPRLEGVLAAAADAPELEFTRARMSFHSLTERDSMGELLLEAGSLKPVRPMRSRKDEELLLQKLHGPVLDVRAHPEVRFTVRRISAERLTGPRLRKLPAGRDTEAPEIRVQGELRVRGHLQRMNLVFQADDRGVYRANFTVELPAFGILPPSHFLGALRVSAKVDVEAEVDLRLSAPASRTFDLTPAFEEAQPTPTPAPVIDPWA